MLRTTFLAAGAVTLASAGLALRAQTTNAEEPRTDAVEADPAALPAGLWWADFDGDGLRDAYAIAQDGQGHLLQNAGDGTFRDVTRTSGLDAISAPNLALWHDFDADGQADLFIGTHSGASFLMRNAADGTFQDITLQAGLGSASGVLSAQVLDYDKDGVADLSLRTVGGDLVFHGTGMGSFEAVDLGLPRPVTRANGVPIASASEGPAASGSTASDQGRSSSTASRGTGKVDGSTGSRRPVAAPRDGFVPPPQTSASGPGSVGPFSFALPICADTIVDQSAPATCIEADSTPTLGRLYPISSSLFVDASTGRVGMNNTSPTFQVDSDSASSATGTGAVKGALLFGLDSRGYLGVQGGTDFDAITTADWNGFELGVVGISTGGSNSDNYGVMGHSNGVGVRGESSISPTLNFAELGLPGIGLRASGTSSAADFLAPTIWTNASGLTTVFIDNDSAGGAYMQLENATSSARITMDGDSGGGGLVTVLAADGSSTVVLDGESTNMGGLVSVRHDTSGETIRLQGEEGSSHGLVDVTGRVDVAASIVPPAPLLNVLATNTGSIGQVINFERTLLGSANDILQIEAGASGSSTGQFIEAERGSDIEFRVDGDGDVFSDGAYTGPADFAEMMRVSTGAQSVQAGDLVVIDPASPMGVRASTKAHSPLVAGIYSTKPGFVGSEREWDKADPAGGEAVSYKREDMAQMYDEVPVAVVGIVPCKVSAENGAIHAGDLLVSSDTPAHAMRAANPKIGTVVGKALEPLAAGRGVIKVLVTLQ